MSSRLSYVWLATRRGVSAGTAASLLRAFGSPEAVFAADRAALTTARDCPLRKVQVDALCDKNTEEAERILAQCAKDGIQIITLGDSAYPDRLCAIENPPVVLYVRGKWPDFDVMPGIAVVGTREATPYGLKTAEHIGSVLARAGFITVSGMALGNDGAAHRGALRAGGLTVAVLAGGVDVCYPPQHRSLMGDILLSGAIISEYPPGTEPRGEHYHARNRIISGLSVATVIVEAPGYRSGALITARAALDQGRDVCRLGHGGGSALTHWTLNLCQDCTTLHPHWRVARKKVRKVRKTRQRGEKRLLLSPLSAIISICRTRPECPSGRSNVRDIGGCRLWGIFCWRFYFALRPPPGSEGGSS